MIQWMTKFSHTNLRNVVVNSHWWREHFYILCYACYSFSFTSWVNRKWNESRSLMLSNENDDYSLPVHRSNIFVWWRTKREREKRKLVLVSQASTLIVLVMRVTTACGVFLFQILFFLSLSSHCQWAHLKQLETIYSIRNACNFQLHPHGLWIKRDRITADWQPPAVYTHRAREREWNKELANRGKTQETMCN